MWLGGAEELLHFNIRLPFFLRRQQRRVRVSQQAVRNQGFPCHDGGERLMHLICME